MSNPDRLSALDTSFLHLERDVAHMHVAACAVFEGPPPDYADLLETIVSRLHLVPHYRQRLAFVPFGQGRPVWVDDPHFNPRFHLRHTALPQPGGDEQLKRLAGRVFAQSLDRARPLWELWLVERLAHDRFALLTKTHHALVDGISGVDIATLLFDTSPDPAPVAPPAEEWVPRPPPSGTQLLADALLERATVPAEIGRGVGAALRGPRRLARRFFETAAALGAFAARGIEPAPSTPFNVPIGPHRRFTWVRGELKDFRAVKSALSGTVNDVVLAAVAGALSTYMRAHGYKTDGIVLKAMVPVSVRAELERGALGNKVAAMWAPLPVGTVEPVRQLEGIRLAMAEIKESGQAVGAQTLTELAGFAPPTMLAQAARLQARQRLFNLVVTNVPGPQQPLYLLGRELECVFPLVPLAKNTAIGIAVMSYNGQMSFGLNGDYDAIPDLESLAEYLQDAVAALVRAANAADPRSARTTDRGQRRRASRSGRLRVIEAE
ncbi:MAG: WS/DGAT/MGAT family O-acyltransferase [Solirubrobacteraceae bacterium]